MNQPLEGIAKNQKDNLLVIGIQEPYQGWLPEDAWKWLDEAAAVGKLTAAR